MSDVESRREARRRRVLENSEKRLQQITGVQQRNASYELEGYKSSQSIEDENVIENHIHNGSLPSSNSLNSNNVPPQLETLYRNPLFSSSFLNRTSVESIDQLSFTSTHRVSVIIGIAFILNSLLIFFDFLLLNKIFIPLLCFEAVCLFYNQSNDTNDEIANILRLFFRHIHPYYLSLAIKYFSLFVTVTRDVMIYFFAFVCISFIFKVLLGILLF